MNDERRKLQERMARWGLDSQPVSRRKIEEIVEQARAEDWTLEQVQEALAMLHPELCDETDKPAA